MNRMPFILLAAGLLLAIALPSFAQEAPITASNWKGHPKVREIRSIVQATDRRIKKGELTTKTRAFCYEGPGWTKHILYANRGGQARKYFREGGSDDSFHTESYYYDDAGALRFYLHTSNNVHGMKGMQRVYLDPQGNLLWEEVSGKAFFEKADVPALRLDPAKTFTSWTGKEIPPGKTEGAFCR